MGRSQSYYQLKKHDVTFHQATKVFDDLMAFEEIDERKDYGEERINVIGMCDGIILHVTYTERGDRIRLISARKAEKDEQDDGLLPMILKPLSGLCNPNLFLYDLAFQPERKIFLQSIKFSRSYNQRRQ